MKNQLAIGLIYLLVTSFFACKEVEVEPTEIVLDAYEQERVDLLNQENHPIGRNPLIISNAALTLLDGVADARIVGLGEATHGTREFFQMKHRMFRYLVEVHGFKAFLFEMDLAEALFFDEWIQGERQDDLVGLMRSKMLFWTWRTEEVQQLFEWMREYNSQKPDSQRIHLYGVDTQYPNYDLDKLIQKVHTLSPEWADSIRLANPKYKQLHQLYENKDQAAANQIEEGIAFTIDFLAENKSTLISMGSEQEFLWMERLARHMEQTATYLYGYYFRNSFDLRDQYMAENSMWYFDLLGQEEKLVLWAHNAHVAKDQSFGLGPSQGGHLNNWLTNDYKVVAFGFSTGTFTAYGGSLRTHRIDGIPVRNSYNFIFNQAESDNFMLDLHQENNSPLNSWLHEGKLFLSLGAVFEFSPSQYYRPLPLAKQFDILVYFDETSFSKLL